MHAGYPNKYIHAITVDHRLPWNILLNLVRQFVKFSSLHSIAVYTDHWLFVKWLWSPTVPRTSGTCTM